ERAAGAPPAIKSWFYPGNSIGEEFVYPRSQAMKIARANHEPVLATSADTRPTGSEQDRLRALHESKGSVARIDENGEARAQMPANSDRADRARDRDRNATSNTIPSTGSSERATATSGRTERKALPATASDLPAFVLLSGVLLAAGLLMRQLRARLM